VTRSSPPSSPGPADSEPAPPTLPPTAADLTPWGDTDIGAPKGPAPVFSTNPPAKTDDQMPTIGHIGRYALKYRIGAGGLGTVYAAHDPLLSRLIAIKTLNLEISAEERDAFNALFLNEARAAGGLSHPNIVTVFDAGVSQQGGDAYIAMELLKGRDLRQLRQEGWRPTPAQAALIVRRVADALAYAHSKGVVHRDVKPANIFMVGRTQPRVLDFGIARIAHQHESGATGDLAAGSPYYMAPEQARHETVDRRADVFSLGVVLYELLTDQKPFRGSTLSEITKAVLEHQPPAANVVEPSVPAALAEIAARAMEKDPEHRYRSARSLSRELRHWLEENAGNGDQAAVDPEPPKRSRVLVLAGAVLAGLGLLAIGLWVGLSAHHEPEVVVAAPVPPVIAAEVAAAPATPAATTSPTAAAPAPTIAPATGAALSPAPEPVAPAPVAATPPPAPAAVTAPAAPAPRAVAPAAPKESPRERRAREARERDAARLAANTPAVVSLGTVRIAVSPWGNVEVDGAAVGTTPPLNELTLPEGRHQITVRNADFPPYSASVNVVPGQPVTLRHRFGS
jgi:eukaryotic-like serine/threonine-protein kinase